MRPEYRLRSCELKYSKEIKNFFVFLFALKISLHIWCPLLVLTNNTKNLQHHIYLVPFEAGLIFVS